MDANAGLVAGSHNRKELVVIRPDNDPKPLQKLNAGLCAICGDGIELATDGEFFVACNECAFPVCRPCYEYERKEGNQACPHCKTRYRRLRGSSRVEGDEEEEGCDDLENEFDYVDEKKRKAQQEMEAKLLAHMQTGPSHDEDLPAHHLMLPVSVQSSNLKETTTTSTGYSPYATEHRAPTMPPVMGGSRRVHPASSIQVSPGSFRLEQGQLDDNHLPPTSIAWRDRLESWRERQMQMSEKGQFVPKENDEDPEPDVPSTDQGRQPLSRKNPIASSLINPYRILIILRLVVLGFFFQYRLLHPVNDAYGLWLTSVVCEIWFAISWILDQFPKWLPVSRETYLDRLTLRYEPEGQPSQLTPVDVFVSTVDPFKEPPIVTANTLLSILSVDYPVDKVSCYVSDDGAAMLTFEVLADTSEFARKWVPFCKKFSIEPRAPEVYFTQKLDYLKDKIQPTFVKERRAMKREYEEFKVRVNARVAKSLKVPDEGWAMQDGTPWPANNQRDHPGMIQLLQARAKSTPSVAVDGRAGKEVFLGHSGGRDEDGNELPRLVYVSREKRPGFNHHKKAGAMNSLVRVSAILTNAPYILNLDCDHYVNNSKAIREAMCFLMDQNAGKKICYVQFPQRFDGIDRNDRYANHNTVFFDINMKGLDGVQGPVYVGTGCVFRRQALYGYYPPLKAPHEPRKSKSCLELCCCGRTSRDSKKHRKIVLSKRAAKKINSNKKSNKIRSETAAPMFTIEDVEEGGAPSGEESNLISAPAVNMEKRFGQSPVLIQSSRQQNGGVAIAVNSGSLLKEAIHVISCGYEDKSEWGKEIGWIYGSVTEDILTGFKMHCRGWRSVYCMPSRPAFKGSAPINLTDRLHQVLRWALGSVEILLSKHCPIWYGHGDGRLKCLERLAYINTTVYPLTSLPLVAYCALPAVCLLTGKFIIPSISNFDSLWFISLFISIFATGILEMRWSRVGIDEWWRNEQFWVIGGVSSHLFALFQGLLKVLAGVDTNFTVTSKAGEDASFGELYAFKWTALLIPPTTLLVINLVGVVAGISDAINNGYQAWGPLFGKLFFAFWVIVHLYPFLKGLMGRQNRTPTIVVVWSILLASIFSLLWVHIDPFLQRTPGPNLESCGVNC